MLYYYCNKCQDYTHEVCQTHNEPQVQQSVTNVAVRFSDGVILPVDDLYNPFFDDLPDAIATKLRITPSAQTVCSECGTPLDSIYTGADTINGLEQMLRDAIESHHEH